MSADLPPVHRLLADAADLVERHGHTLVAGEARALLAEVGAAIQSGRPTHGAESLREELPQGYAPWSCKTLAEPVHSSSRSTCGLLASVQKLRISVDLCARILDDLFPTLQIRLKDLQELG